MTEVGPGAFACDACGSVYPGPERALACEAEPVEAEAISRGTLVRARGGGAATGPGWVTRSFLVGLDDPRGPAHTRFYRASFVWGRADFRAEDLESLGPATEAEWRALVERGPTEE